MFRHRLSSYKHASDYFPTNTIRDEHGYRVTGTFARGLEADVPVTRETQIFALKVNELRLPCRSKNSTMKYSIVR